MQPTVRVAGLALAATLVLAACGGPTGTVKIIEVGPPPDPQGFGNLFDGVALQVTYEVSGPTSGAIVVCKFSGKHTSDAGTVLHDGWIEYDLIADLKAGETTRGDCGAWAFRAFGDEAPSQPVVSLGQRSAPEAAPSGWTVNYAPPTPWP